MVHRLYIFVTKPVCRRNQHHSLGVCYQLLPKEKRGGFTPRGPNFTRRFFHSTVELPYRFGSVVPPWGRDAIHPLPCCGARVAWFEQPTVGMRMDGDLFREVAEDRPRAKRSRLIVAATCGTLVKPSRNTACLACPAPARGTPSGSCPIRAGRVGSLPCPCRGRFA